MITNLTAQERAYVASFLEGKPATLPITRSKVAGSFPNLQPFDQLVYAGEHVRKMSALAYFSKRK